MSHSVSQVAVNQVGLTLVDAPTEECTVHMRQADLTAHPGAAACQCVAGHPTVGGCANQGWGLVSQGLYTLIPGPY